VIRQGLEIGGLPGVRMIDGRPIDRGHRRICVELSARVAKLAHRLPASLAKNGKSYSILTRRIDPVEHTSGARSICCASVRQSTMFFRSRRDAGSETKGAGYGSGLQHLSWNGWLGGVAQPGCRKFVDPASRPVSTQ